MSFELGSPDGSYNIRFIYKQKHFRWNITF